MGQPYFSRIRKKIREGSRELKKETSERTRGYIEAGLGLVAGLAWNDAVKTLIETFFPLNKSTILAKFIYALVITGIVVILSSYLIKQAKKDDSESSENWLLIKKDYITKHEQKNIPNNLNNHKSGS